MQVDDPVLEAAEDDIAAVLGDGWAHARLDQLLDLRGDLVVLVGLCSLRRPPRPR